ncbi:MAG: alpha/beta hydrolase [Bryobacteraceae bacterium]|jgi:pimeloyl-ACP methyl ester carboxylesterase
MRAPALLGLLLSLPAFGEYAEIHGIKMYYEIHGEGRPVVLLHGGTSTIQSSFAAQIPVLALNHRVIAIEQMGHGHTGDVAGRELSYEGMAEDTAALLAQLGIQSADVVGWSDGGQLALRLAFTHPELVRRVVASGVGLGAVTPQMQQAMRALSPDRWNAQVRDEYARVSPDGPQHWPVFFDKVRTMWAKPSWGFSEADLGRIKAPVMIVAGDRDFTRIEETARIVRAIPGARLAILPGTDHFTFQKRPSWLNPIMLDFLDGN